MNSSIRLTLSLILSSLISPFSTAFTTASKASVKLAGSRSISQPALILRKDLNSYRATSIRISSVTSGSTAFRNSESLCHHSAKNVRSANGRSGAQAVQDTALITITTGRESALRTFSFNIFL